MESTMFFILLFVHLSFLILGFGSVLVTDLYGLLWIRDRVRFTQIVKVSGVIEKFVWTGWAGMLASGIPLLILKGEIDNLMILKLAFVVLIGINGIFLHLIQKKLREFRDGDEVPDIFMFRLILSITVSQLGWWGAIIIGFLHRHIWSVIEWPDAPWLIVGLIVAGLLIIWAFGEALFKKKSDE